MKKLLKHMVAHTDDERMVMLGEIADSRDIRGVRHILKTVEGRLNELRKSYEENPQRSDKLDDDVVFQLGMANMARWVVSLPETARALLNKSNKGESS